MVRFRIQVLIKPCNKLSIAIARLITFREPAPKPN
jgi:hypothetical protein